MRGQAYFIMLLISKIGCHKLVQVRISNNIKALENLSLMEKLFFFLLTNKFPFQLFCLS